MSRLSAFPKRPKPRAGRDRPARRTRWARPVLVLFGVGLIFALGFYGGRYGIPPHQLMAGDTGRPIDLTNFYQAKKLIEEHYPGTVSEDDLAVGASRGLVSGLRDPYSTYLTKEEASDLQSQLAGTVEGIGIEVGLQDDQVTVISPVKDSPADRAGVQAGDVVTAVDGKPTVGLTVDEVAEQIRGEQGTRVTVDFRSPGQVQPRSVTLTREEISSPSVELRYESDVAIIELSRFDQNTESELDRAVADIQARQPQSRGIVLDLRGNPGGYLDGAIDVSSVFLEGGSVVQEKFKDRTEAQSAEDDGRLAGYPLVVLVDRGSASASEIVAGALRDNRQIPLVGERTYGKGSVQELMQLGRGAILKLTIAELLTPAGTSITKEGLAPDVEIPSDDPDAQLQAAIGKL